MSKDVGGYRAYAPLLGREVEPEFLEATRIEIDNCCATARSAFEQQCSIGSNERATLLRRIANALEMSGDALIERANLETDLPIQRLVAERARTVGQLRLFADLVAEGSWVDARIDLPHPDRKPAPRPDL